MGALTAFFGFLCVLGFLAVLGHGIWVLGRAILSAFRPKQAGSSPRFSTCPACRERSPSSDVFCRACGLNLRSKLADSIDRLRLAQREVRRLVERDELDSETAERVAERLDIRIQSLLKPSREPDRPRPVAVPVREAAAEGPVSQLGLPQADVLVPGQAESTPAPLSAQSRRQGVLAAFLEEKNILWGELVGGLLIVGCSIALVLTLWRDLRDLPYSSFLLAAGITAALFGAGQYTLHHWRLATTSRGLLVIAMLLAPLNLLLLADPGSDSASDTLDIAIRVAAVLAFLVMARASGRDLIHAERLPGPVDRRWLLALAVVGAPATQIIPAGNDPLLARWMPLACYVLAIAGILLGVKRRLRDKECPDATPSVLMFIGLSLYALLASWGWLLTRSAERLAALHDFALPLAVAGIPLIEAGLFAQRRYVARVGWRVAGTATALIGAVFLYTGIGLAWPAPLEVMLAALLAGAAISRAAWVEQLPWFHVGSLPALAYAAILGAHGLAGHWEDPTGMLPLFGTPLTGLTLTGFAVVLAIASELILRLGNRPQAIAHAIGALASATLASLVVSFAGGREAWPAAVVYGVFGLGLLATNLRWRMRALADAGVLILIVGTLWTLEAVARDDRAWWGLAMSFESLALALAALASTAAASKPGLRGLLFQQYRIAIANGAIATGIAAAILTLAAPGFPHGSQHSAAVFLLVPACLFLTRVFAASWPTWLAPGVLLLGLVHFFDSTGNLEPIRAILLLSLLTQATLALVGSFVFRGRRSIERLYGTPLREWARVSTILAALLLLMPGEGLKLEWAAAALWLATIWLVLAWVRRETLAFLGMHLALIAGSILLALGWADRQPWGDAADPRAAQAIGMVLTLLALAGGIARRLSIRSRRLNFLWQSAPLPMDRLLLIGLALGQILLLSVAIAPFALAELTPIGSATGISIADRLVFAFSTGTWAVLGTLAVALLAAIRLARADDRECDALVVGLLFVLFGAGVAAAGAFTADVAAASALRWTLAAAFLLGSLLMAVRSIVARLARSLGVTLRTSDVTPKAIYACLAVSAVITILITTSSAEIGLSGRVPSGPMQGTLFAEIGWTWSLLVPLVALLAGLSLTAVRERSAAYAFAGGTVFAAAIAGGYALKVVVAGGSIDAFVQMRVAMLLTGSIAIWSLLWLGVEKWVPGRTLLSVQTILGLVAFAFITVIPLARLFMSPVQPLPDHYAEFAWWGWLILALATGAAWWHATRVQPLAREHVVGFAALCSGVLLACTLQSLHELDHAIPFHALTAVWAIAGLAFTAANFKCPPFASGGWLIAFSGALVLAVFLGPVPETGRWIIPLSLGGYVLVSAAIVWRVGSASVAGEARWGSLIAANLLLALPVIGFALFESIHLATVSERLTGAGCVLLLAAASGLLASRSTQTWTARLQSASIVLMSTGLVLSGWAVPEPESPAVWLQRNGWGFVALVAAMLIALVVLPRSLSGSSWCDASRRAGAWLAAAALALLLVVLIQQIPVFDPVARRTPLGLGEVLAILTAILVLIVQAVRAAVVPSADPIALKDSQRMAYVYLAEVLVVCLFVHIRLNLPELFPPQAGRYWTFIVMLFAFVGIGAAELCEQRGLRVLARPLRQTGVLLPMIPLLAFWAKPPGLLIEWAEGSAPGARPFLSYLEKLPQYYDSYAMLWFLAGFLYSLAALSRKSFGWALLAALATNAGMWALLAHNEVAAAVHPQVWVIPLALIVLVSEHIHRGRLEPRVSAGLRYLGIGMIYLSSSADMFIADVGQSLWLPIVLAAFCVAGIFAGILLRVQAFLFLGIGFLVLDIFAMIWHAAVDRSQTWVWYVSGIALGIAILALFALFEKRRNEVLGVVDRIRTWD